MQLKQKTLFQQRVFTLGQSALRLDVQDLNGSTSIDVSYENLLQDVGESTRRYANLFFAGVCTTVIAAGYLLLQVLGFGDEEMASAILWLFFSSILFITYFSLEQNFLLIKTAHNSPIEFIWTKSGQSELDTFVAELMLRRRSYLRKLYYYVDPNNVHQDELRRLTWLHEEGAISEEEWRLSVDQLNEDLEPSHSPDCLH